MKLVSTALQGLWGIDRPRALVEDPDGIGHVLRIRDVHGYKVG